MKPFPGVTRLPESVYDKQAANGVEAKWATYNKGIQPW
jgi:hypothetical protein